MTLEIGCGSRSCSVPLHRHFGHHPPGGPRVRSGLKPYMTGPEAGVREAEGHCSEEEGASRTPYSGVLQWYQPFRPLGLLGGMGTAGGPLRTGRGILEPARFSVCCHPPSLGSKVDHGGGGTAHPHLAVDTSPSSGYHWTGGVGETCHAHRCPRQSWGRTHR